MNKITKRILYIKALFRLAKNNHTSVPNVYHEISKAIDIAILTNANLLLLVPHKGMKPTPFELIDYLISEVTHSL